MSLFSFQLFRNFPSNNRSKQVNDHLKLFKKWFAAFYQTERKEMRVVYKGNRIYSESQTVVERYWYDGKRVEDLPGYICWPSENRYARILWWGYGKDGLYFIEKGKGYRYANDEGIFHPASEGEYLQFIRSTSN